MTKIFLSVVGDWRYILPFLKRKDLVLVQWVKENNVLASNVFLILLALYRLFASNKKKSWVDSKLMTFDEQIRESKPLKIWRDRHFKGGTGPKNFLI